MKALFYIKNEAQKIVEAWHKLETLSNGMSFFLLTHHQRSVTFKFDLKQGGKIKNDKFKSGGLNLPVIVSILSTTQKNGYPRLQQFPVSRGNWSELFQPSFFCFLKRLCQFMRSPNLCIFYYLLNKTKVRFCYILAMSMFLLDLAKWNNPRN